MARIASYVEVDGLSFRPPEVEGVAETFEYLCFLEGRHYVALFHPAPEQAPEIDFRIHDLGEQPELREKLEREAAPYRKVRHERAARYPDLGDQMDAVLKALNQLRMSGFDLPQETDNLIGQWLAVKRNHPKPKILDETDA